MPSLGELLTQVINSRARLGQDGKVDSTQLPVVDTSSLAPKASPVFTGSISLGRDSRYTTGGYSIAVGNTARASESNTAALGYGAKAIGWSSTACGYMVESTGYCSFTAGRQSQATAQYSVALGYQTKAQGEGAFAEGYGATAGAAYSHAEGYGTSASNSSAHAEGNSTSASGQCSHAEGWNTTASGLCSHAEGFYCTASGANAHAEGVNVTASGDYSHAEGMYTVASGECTHVGGAYNIANDYDSNIPVWTTNTEYAVGDIVRYTLTNPDKIKKCITAHTSGPLNMNADSSKWLTIGSRMKYVEIIGNGLENANSNARALDWEGNEYLNGNLYVGCNANSTGGSKVATEAYVDARIPAPPVSDGTYNLQVSISSGVATYSWVAAPGSANGVSF